MRALDLRAEAAGNPRLDTFVRRFFTLLGKNDWAEAARLVSDPIMVFDQEVPRARFAHNDDGSIGGHVEELKQLPPTIPFSVEEQLQLFGGPLDGALLACFATVRVDSRRVTYGLLVNLADASDPRVARLFDPTPFKAFAEQLSHTA